MRPLLKDKILLRGYLGGYPFAVWRREAIVLFCRIERTGARTGRGAGGGGRRRGAGAWAAARPEVPARPGRLGGERARSLPRSLARHPDQAPRSPAGERRASPAGCNVGRPARTLSAPASSSSAQGHLPLRLPLMPLLPSLLSVLLRSFLSSLSFLLLLPQQTLLVAPEAPGCLGCFLPGWNYRTTFPLFWKRSQGF